MLLTHNVCDLCPDHLKTAKTFSISLNKNVVDVDLCTEHADELNNLLDPFFSARPENARVEKQDVPIVTCGLCGKTGSKTWRRKHAQEAHNVSPALTDSASPATKVYVCPDCGFKLPSVKHVRIHAIQKHGWKFPAGEKISESNPEKFNIKVLDRSSLGAPNE